MRRESWQQKASATKRERRDTFYGAMEGGLRRWLVANGPPFHVTMTRIVPPHGKLFDEGGGGNLSIGFKAIRDEIAKLLGVDDSPDAPVTWECDQERGSEAGVKVVIASVFHATVRCARR